MKKTILLMCLLSSAMASAAEEPKDPFTIDGKKGKVIISNAVIVTKQKIYSDGVAGIDYDYQTFPNVAEAKCLSEQNQRVKRVLQKNTQYVDVMSAQGLNEFIVRLYDLKKSAGTPFQSFPTLAVLHSEFILLDVALTADGKCTSLAEEEIEVKLKALVENKESKVKLVKIVESKGINESPEKYKIDGEVIVPLSDKVMPFAIGAEWSDQMTRVELISLYRLRVLGDELHVVLTHEKNAFPLKKWTVLADSTYVFKLGQEFRFESRIGKKDFRTRMTIIKD